MRELIQTIVSGQQITDGLQNLVIDLSEQISEALVLQSPPGEVYHPRTVEENVTDSRKRKLLEKRLKDWRSN